LRLVFAILRSSALLIDLYIPLEAPLSEDLERLPRFAASAAPAAICCFFDFAGIQKDFAAQSRNGFISVAANFPPKEVSRHTGQDDEDSDPRSFGREKAKIDN
jgi:hypothetical protein